MANIDPDVSGAPASPVTPLMGRSALANELRRLPARLRRTLELRNWVIDTIDVAISTFVVFTDPHEERSLDERFDWLQSQVQGGDEGEDSSEFDGDLADLTAKLNAFAETELPRWVKRLSRDGHWKRFARKLLGSGSYDRLAGALLADCAAIAGGLRDIVRIAQPFAVAFDDVLKVLTPQQIQTV